jgi:hypothetical protein
MQPPLHVVAVFCTSKVEVWLLFLMWHGARQKTTDLKLAHLKFRYQHFHTLGERSKKRETRKREHEKNISISYL